MDAWSQIIPVNPFIDPGRIFLHANRKHDTRSDLIIFFYDTLPFFGLHQVTVTVVPEHHQFIAVIRLVLAFAHRGRDIAEAFPESSGDILKRRSS